MNIALTNIEIKLKLEKQNPENNQKILINTDNNLAINQKKTREIIDKERKISGEIKFKLFITFVPQNHT